MFKYTNEPLPNLICTNLDSFPEQKSEHLIKLGSKFIFHFVDIIEVKVFIQGVIGFSLFYHSIN